MTIIPYEQDSLLHGVGVTVGVRVWVAVCVGEPVWVGAGVGQTFLLGLHGVGVAARFVGVGEMVGVGVHVDVCVGVPPVGVAVSVPLGTVVRVGGSVAAGVGQTCLLGLHGVGVAA